MSGNYYVLKFVQPTIGEDIHEGRVSTKLEHLLLINDIGVPVVHCQSIKKW